jgi:aminopeptidase
MEQLLEKYASLAINVGVNIQQGQTLLIRSSISSAPFTRLIVKKAYEAGAKDVNILWSDDKITRLRYDLAPDDAFKEFPEYYVNAHDEAVKKNHALLSIVSVDPDLLNGVAPQRIAEATKAAGLAMDEFRRALQADKVSWSIVAVPSVAWAAKVFPDLETTEAQVEALWNAIFSATRANLDDPVAAWEAHIKNLTAKSDFLNDKKFHALHFEAPGTDLTIELPEKHFWCAAESVNEKGATFTANIPTEEVFTMPRKAGVNGIVSSKKPLSYGGNLIDNFSLTFKDGAIVDFTAETGYETLKTLIETDDGSKYLGEVALVPHSSPISTSNLIFYNTLFDENASVHLAIGSAYAFNLVGGKTMSPEELEGEGANNSIVHVDFMIGCAEMNIDALSKDGSKTPIFRNGEWVI